MGGGKFLIFAVRKNIRPKEELNLICCRVVGRRVRGLVATQCFRS